MFTGAASSVRGRGGALAFSSAKFGVQPPLAPDAIETQQNKITKSEEELEDDLGPE